MKMNDEANNSCSFGENILAYLYGELPPKNRDIFEMHLENCSPCIDEFAELSVARYSVYEWKNVEFAPLATPEIVVPIERNTPRSTWLDSIRTAFAWNSGWAYAGGAAAIILAAVFGLTMLRDSGEPTVARGLEEKNAPSNGALSSVPARSSETVQAPEAPAVGQPDEAEVAARPGAVARKRTEIAATRPARRANAETAAARRASPNGRLQNSPTLGQYVDDRDESLRLTDIFEDLDTKELD